ncbi:MAG: AraC family transcriptional regulator [Termitinemataceae bacterium]|nr:MAG: AraC family transcriptional regulator [Termitinemataceae bacterium]
MESDYKRTKDILKEKMLHHLPQAGRFITPIDGLQFFRKDTLDKTGESENCFYKPLIIIVIQGFKHSVIGNETYQYGEDYCVTCGMDLPAVTTLTKASNKNPFLSISLSLDRHLVSQLLAEEKNKINHEQKSEKNEEYKGTAISVTKTEKNVLDAFLRLINLLDTPQEIPILAPMIIREIHYRMLCSPHGCVIRAVSDVGTKSNRIADAVSWLREHYTEPFHVEILADKVNMSVPNFNRYFRAVTSLSPLQFQKRLRLCEAQRLMVSVDKDATQAAYAVGYESTTQFNREYKRLFGAPPLRDTNWRRI